MRRKWKKRPETFNSKFDNSFVEKEHTTNKFPCIEHERKSHRGREEKGLLARGIENT